MSMRKFERPRARRRVKTDTDLTNKTFVADLTSRLRTSCAPTHNGVQITQASANITAGSCAEDAKNATVNAGKTAPPNLGTIQLQLRPCRSHAHKGQAQSYSAGKEFLHNPKYMVTKMKTAWGRLLKNTAEKVVNSETWEGPVTDLPQAPRCKEGVNKSEVGSVIACGCDEAHRQQQRGTDARSNQHQKEHVPDAAQGKHSDGSYAKDTQMHGHGGYEYGLQEQGYNGHGNGHGHGQQEYGCDNYSNGHARGDGTHGQWGGGYHYGSYAR